MKRHKNKTPGTDSALRAEMVANLERLRRFAYALTGSPADADDILQGTVERVLSKGTPHGADVAKWMFRVCRNLWIDEIRSRARGPAYGDPAELGRTQADPGEGESTVHGRLELGEVQQTMQALPPEQRQVLALVALEGYSYRETAEILEIPIGTVMSRLTRARTKVAERLQRQSETE